MDLNQLPNEVLEHVFCHIPCQDLMRTMRIVCRRWNDIIVRRRFQPWKKSYFRYKVGENGRGLIGESDDDDEPPKKKNKKKEPSLQLDLDWKIEELKKAMSNVTSVWNEKINGNQYLHPPKAVNGDADVNFRLEIAAPWLVKFMSEEFSQFEKEGNFKQIDKHAKFRMVQEFLQERMPKFAKNDIASIVILCCIANDAWDCEEIIRVLTKPSLRSCSSLDTSEVVYSIALAFLVFHREYSLPSKWHYNVFHAISFFENEFNAGIEEKKKSSVKLTAEQARIANHQLSKRGELVKIVAFAGTGKTTTLIQMTQNHPKLNFLVVVYNKAVKEHGELVFPEENVKVRTAHSLAMEKVGKRYRDHMYPKEKGKEKWVKTGKLIDNLKAQDLMRKGMVFDTGLWDTGKKRLNADSMHQRAAQVVQSIQNYMNSPDEEITLENVPSRWEVTTKTAGQENFVTLHPEQRKIVLKNAINVWKAMVNLDSDKLGMPHDGYLKLFQLEKPNLQRNYEHEVLMIDEGQDMNPAMLDIFNCQKTTKIIVGDPHQQIYRFRGAINALDSIQATHVYHLTQSFRFGPQIGLASNSCLEMLQKVKKQTLVGGKKQDFLIQREDIVDIPKYKPIAVIGRKNFTVFQEVVDLICTPSNPPKASYKIDDSYLLALQDLYYLSKGQPEKISSNGIKNFSTFGAFRNFAKETNDNELCGKVRIVEKYGDRIPEILKSIKKRCRYPEKLTDYVFTTTHKAKGLEWKTVILLNDFTEVANGIMSDRSKSGDEADEENILYVAMTRAKEYLAINFSVFDILVSSGETMDKVVHMREKKFNQHNLQCLECHDNIVFEENVLGLESREMNVKRVVYNPAPNDPFGQFEPVPVRVNIVKISGTFCSVCATSQKFKDSGIMGTTRMANRFMKNRIFLRFLTGVLPEKFKEALSKVYVGRTQFAGFILPVHLLWPQAFEDDFDDLDDFDELEMLEAEAFGEVVGEEESDSVEEGEEEDAVADDEEEHKAKESEESEVERQVDSSQDKFAGQDAKAIADAMEDDFDEDPDSQAIMKAMEDDF